MFFPKRYKADFEGNRKILTAKYLILTEITNHYLPQKSPTN